MEDIHDEKEHDHSPIFNIHLYKSDSNKEIDSAQAINPSGRVNFIINESKTIILFKKALLIVCV